MPLRGALRWFSEICGLCLGAGLVWCVVEIRILHERIDGLQRSMPKTVMQNNHQSVTVESDAMKLAREILRNEDANGNLP